MALHFKGLLLSCRVRPWAVRGPMQHGHRALGAGDIIMKDL